MDSREYFEKQDQQSADYEAICLRCGACCGALDGDPCLNLVKAADNKYFCKSYDTRIGTQKTVSGKQFHCVPIRNVLEYDGAHPGCAYKKKASL